MFHSSRVFAAFHPHKKFKIEKRQLVHKNAVQMPSGDARIDFEEEVSPGKETAVVTF